ncbi:MAG: Fic family protein [Planctomycetota bacterium]
MTVRTLGEYRGRQDLFQRQSPEVLDTLKRAAMVQSVESSNRIEGVTVAANRLVPLVNRKVTPQDRSESEIAGYRDVLAEIHTKAGRLTLTPGFIRDCHRRMFAMVGEKGGHWKEKDNAILEVRSDGRSVVRFKPVSALAVPAYMEKSCTLYRRAINGRQVDPLLLIGAFILDFECIHPFRDGNGRLGRLLTLLLLYQAGYEVGRYISLERIVEQSKETYYDALYRSSQGWHEARHDLRSWWNYFLGTLVAAYKEFEERVGSVTTVRGAKREMVRNAVERLPVQFRLADIQQACPGVSYPTLKRALAELRKAGRIRCLGRGRDAEWARIRSRSH